MQIAEKALNELKKSMLILDFGNKFVNFLLIFFISLLIFNIINISWVYSFIPAAIYFLVVMTIDFALNVFYNVEKKVPELHEQLRTVADNVNRSNEILDSLKQDVVKNMKKVKTSYFVNVKHLGIRIISLCVLAFLIVVVSFMNVKFEFSGFDFYNSDNKLRNAGEKAVRVEYRLSEGNLSDVLGNKTLAELGTKEFRLEINPLDSDADFSILEDTEEKDFNSPDFPKEIYTRYDVAYNEKIAKENQDVVRNYFEEITGENNG